MKLDPIALNPSLLAKPAVDPKHLDMKRIDETAREFEAMFMAEMLRPMFDGIKVNETFGGGKGEEIFSDLLLDEYGKSMASQGTLGIADLVKEQLIEMQSRAQEQSLAQNMQGNSTGPTPSTGENDV